MNHQQNWTETGEAHTNTISRMVTFMGGMYGQEEMGHFTGA